MKARVIAFYLPQFHPIPINNKYYGNGFTEWTNVGKATPLFPGHYQPHVPADLGYYDLRNPETRELQANLAEEAGIEGFCYYHYWFGRGHKELHIPFEKVVESGKPNFPFCLCWANQSWYAKFWSKSQMSDKQPIAIQEYDDEEGNREHFLYLLKAFMDERYIKVDGKLLFMIYRPLEFPGIKDFIKQWRHLADEYKLPGFNFIAQATSERDARDILSLGFDGCNLVRLNEVLLNRSKKLKSILYLKKLFRLFRMTLWSLSGLEGATGLKQFGGVLPVEYSEAIQSMNVEGGIESEDNIFPTILPNWDHSPRSGINALVLHNSTPELFRKHIADMLKYVKNKPYEKKIIFLKSWNEWGEGNYMEPDLKWGHGFLLALRDML